MSASPHFCARWSMPDERVGYTETASPAKQRLNRGFDAAFNICLSAGPVQHEVLRNLEIVKALGGQVADSRLEISLTDRDREFASKLLANVPAASTVVAVGIGGRSAGRRWPLENYAQSLTRLGKEHRVQPVIICSARRKGRSWQACQACCPAKPSSSVARRSVRCVPCWSAAIFSSETTAEARIWRRR